jgi:hypothetical protein
VRDVVVNDHTTDRPSITLIDDAGNPERLDRALVAGCGGSRTVSWPSARPQARLLYTLTATRYWITSTNSTLVQRRRRARDQWNLI